MRSLVCLLLLGLLISCSGSGGSDSSTQGGIEEGIERDQAFLDQAINLALSVSTATCTEVICAKPEHGHLWYDAINDLERGACDYDCMPVAIDDSGEVRKYVVRVTFQRFPDGCFPREGEIFVIGEFQDLCRDSF